MDKNKHIFFRILDVFCILFALVSSSWFILPPNLNIFEDYTGASTFTLLIFFLCFYMLNCYALTQESFRDSSIRVFVAVFIGIIGTGFLFYSFENWRFPRLMFVIQMLITLFLCLGWRWLYYRFRSSVNLKPDYLIFLGAAKAHRARRMLREYEPDSIILGYFGPAGADEAAGPCLGPANAILAEANKHKYCKVLVLEPGLLSKEVAAALLEAKLTGLALEDMRTLYERLALRIPVDLIEDRWLLLTNGFNLNATDPLRRFKRAFDVCFSLGLLVLASPLLLLFILLVRLESPGSCIYRQQRIGLYGKEFTLYKIRSMRQDAEKNGAVWARENDVRITRIGKFIRKTRIDELPQLVNVLKGEMSVIGPRPERPDFVHQLQNELPYYYVRHYVKPGITGWAQVSYPYGASLEDSRYKLEYDLFYIKNLSFLLEVRILLKTIGVVLFPKGAR